MKYSKRKDRYCCNVLNDNFHEIDSRLNDLEENGGGSGGGGSTDIDYSKIEFDTEEIVVETEATTLNILDSLTEIKANTESGKIAGALAVKELGDSLNENNADIIICSPVGLKENEETVVDVSALDINLRYSKYKSIAVSFIDINSLGAYAIGSAVAYEDYWRVFVKANKTAYFAIKLMCFKN